MQKELLTRLFTAGMSIAFFMLIISILLNVPFQTLFHDWRAWVAWALFTLLATVYVRPR